jgi:hypothetical protein
MIYAIVAIAVALAILAAYVIDRFSSLGNNTNALNNYAMASFERILRLEAIVDQFIEIQEEEEDDDET